MSVMPNNLYIQHSNEKCNVVSNMTPRSFIQSVRKFETLLLVLRALIVVI
jgi:hypothetical protein